ncbi:MAG TPA: colanic acid biosynthesis glycosyltransferase WcaL [Gammaproteobacteria bacterium]|nr:colanic acid biosynthesis glycosyltransferase WcaL [Gammaproteobacteria bacterium]
MRIAYFLNEFPALSQTFILNQITGMMDRGHEVDIYAKYRFSSEACHAQVEEYRLMERARIFSDVPRGGVRRLARVVRLVIERGLWRSPLLLARVLKGWGHAGEILNLRSIYHVLAFADRPYYDILHCQFGTLGPLVLKLRRLGITDGAIVTSFRGYDLTRNAERNPRFYRELFVSGARFLPVSQSLADRLLEAGCPEDRLQILHSGIDCSRFTFTRRTRSRDGETRVLSIGRLVEKKGLVYALEAVANAHRAGRKVHYTLVGDGQLKAQIETRIRELGIEAIVTLKGWCNHDEIIRLLEESHLLVAPSITAADGDQEGIPNVAKEAMATGLPVLSTWHGGIPELVENGVTGYLVPERDVEALTERLVRFCDEPGEWAGMGERARAKIEAEFDRERINDELESLYAQVSQVGG